MGIVRYRAFRTRGVYADFQVFRRIIAEGYQQKLFPMVRRAAQKRTAGWRVKVDWDQDIMMGREGISHHMYPVGPGAVFWARVSRGVEGHYIFAKKQETWRGVGKYAPTLKLQRYVPFTTPRGGYGGAGVRVGAVGYRQAVWWPGIRPRNYEGHIANEVRERYIRLTENLMRRGVRAAQRRGK